MNKSQGANYVCCFCSDGHTHTHTHARTHTHTHTPHKQDLCANCNNGKHCTVIFNCTQLIQSASHGTIN